MLDSTSSPADAAVVQIGVAMTPGSTTDTFTP